MIPFVNNSRSLSYIPEIILLELLTIHVFYSVTSCQITGHEYFPSKRQHVFIFEERNKLMSAKCLKVP